MNMLPFFPTDQALEEAAVPVVAGALLQLILPGTRNGETAFNIRNQITEVAGAYNGRWECARAASEAFGWLEARGFISQSPHADVGWSIITRDGLRAAQVRDFAAWTAERDLPEALLHPVVAAECLDSFRAGKFDTAVFEAFKALEVRIRDSARLGHDLVGVSLASKAFHPEEGRLTDHTAEGGERVALMKLMSGAIGYFKNPQSHRKVDLGAFEAREMIIIASHLYAIAEIRSLEWLDTLGGDD